MKGRGLGTRIRLSPQRFYVGLGSVSTPPDARRHPAVVRWCELEHTVSDYKTGEAFELVFNNNDNALDVFHHPYACAASRRPDFGSERAMTMRLKSCSPIV